ncbi:DUF7676 family protein [Sorangium sp. So ce406]|uniref:DUF7676 family protein n=1 Tax=Sorangium sp. So ce406 TaxID=3133311 RepID=UPI003F5B0994
MRGPRELARWRQCARAAFYRDLDANGRPRSRGSGLWSGRDEQMMTVFFPNPWLDQERMKPVKEPDWSRLALWMDLRARFAGVPPEPAPVDGPRRPQICG